MIKNYPLILITFLCFVISGYGQTTIGIQDFENTPATPTLTYTNTNGFITTGTGPVPNDDNFVSGSRGFETSNQTATVTFAPVDASAYTSVYFTCRLASFGSTTNGADGGDEIFVEISDDGGTTWSSELEVEGNSNAKWSFDTGTATATTTYDNDNNATTFAPAGGGNRTTDGYSTIVVDGLPNVNNLRVRLIINNNNTNEDWVVDDAEILGTPSAPCVTPANQPTSLILNNITSSSIDGTFTAATTDGYLVVASTSATLGANPVNGTTYNNGDSIGSGTVVQSSNATSFNASGLSQGTQYYFFVFSLNGSSCSGGPLYNTTNPLAGNATTITGPCASESFVNIADNGSYNTKTWTGDNSVDWTATDSRSDEDLAGDEAIMLRNGSLTNDTSIAGGCGIISFDYARIYSGNSTLQVLINGTQYGGNITVSATGSTTFSTTVNVPGPIDVELQNSGNRTLISNLSWTCYTGGANPELQLVDNTATNQNCGYTIDYGDVASDGSFSDLTFDIENNGSVDLNVSSFNITGDYSIVSPATPFVITSGNSQTVTVRFTPISDGTITGVLTINNDDLDESACTVNLTGVGFTPSANIIVRGIIGSNPTIPNGSITASGLNNTLFLAQDINDVPVQTKGFRIGNEGGTDVLNINSITLSGVGAPDFSVTANLSNPATNPLAINADLDFTITFNPVTNSGIRVATVTIANSDPNKAPYTFIVQGTANCPSVSGSISPASGPAGTTVTVLSPGNSFIGFLSAELNGVPLDLVSESMSELVVRLPNTITTGGPLSIELSNGCIFSNTFTFLDETIAGCQTSTSATVDDLFISEVTDSPSGSLTYVELYNATGAALNFATTNYSILLYNNGNTSSPKTLILNSGTVANNSTYVISFGVTTGNQCAVTGGDGSLAQVDQPLPGASINFFRNVSGVDNPNLGHDFIGLYSPAAVTMANPDGVVDTWGTLGDETWAVGLGLGTKGANFQRDSASMIPNSSTVFDASAWTITNWNEADCSDVDYSTIGAYDFSTGVPPTVTLQPTDPVFACTFSASLTITGAEGFNGPTPPDTQNLTYQWYFNMPGSASWSEILPTNTNYNGQQAATLNIVDTSNLEGYQYYCQLREDDATCYTASNAATIIINSVTWDGNWTWNDGTPINTPPTLSDVVILASNYSTANSGLQQSFDACNLIINDNVTLTINNGNYVRVENNLMVNNTTAGGINIEPQGSFVQINDSGSVTASTSTNLTVNKETAFANNAYEYTYWSSPVIGETVGGALADSDPNRRYLFNAQNYLDSTFEVGNNGGTNNGAGVDDIDDDNNDWQAITNASTILNFGVGYATAHDPSVFNSTPGCPGCRIRYTFSGLFNNGNANTVTIYRNDAETGDNNWNLIGNPYPSAIAVNGPNGFLTQNTAIIDGNVTGGAIDGAIFIWSQSTIPTDTDNGNQNINFSQSDYAIINGVGAISAGGDTNGDGTTDNSDRPDGFIPSGQAFFISMSDTSPAYDGNPTIKSSNIVFNNAMRTTGNNNLFFRNPETNQDNKIWVNLKSDNGVFSEILIGYLENASNEYDGMYYDTPRNGSTEVNSVIYTTIPDVEKQFAIQGKNLNSLNLDEVIPLGFNTSINVPTIYTLSIAQLEGEFMTGNSIYVIDRLNNSIHELSETDYTFTSDTGEFNNRFEIVFTPDALSIDDEVYNANDFTINELENDLVKFSTNSALTIETITIFDLLGRRLYHFKGKNSTETKFFTNLSDNIYIAEVKLSNGSTVVKKALKR